MTSNNHSKPDATLSSSRRINQTVQRSMPLLLCLLALAAGTIGWRGRIGQVSAASPTQDAKASSDGLWQEIDETPLRASQAQREIVPQAYRTVRLNQETLRQLLDQAPMEFTEAAKGTRLVMTLPLPDGKFAKFRIEESQIMEPGLAAQFPDIKTYHGQGLDDPTAMLRFDLTPNGFHAMVLSEHETVYVDPYAKGETENYISYYKRDYRKDGERFQCLVSQVNPTPDSSTNQRVEVASGATLRTYRLAVAATGEYTAFHGGTVAGALAAIMTTMNRVNNIYQREVAVRLVLVAGEASIIYTNAATDPYTNGNPYAMIGENQRNLTTLIGSANFDIGHVFGTNSGGLAGVGVGCADDYKARGVTGSSAPVGDAFDVDYVAHELGHQFGANHTFNGSIGSCAGSTREPRAAYEPGSGSTIMAYAGICGAQNLQPNSDDYFHIKSIEEILAFINGRGNGCAMSTATGNTPPTVNAGPNYTIPTRTPIKLTASGNDPDGEALTYCLEEYDLGDAAPPDTDADGRPRPIFRSSRPTTNPARTFPKLFDILSNTASYGEALPTIGRPMTFQVTARDNRVGGGGVSSATTQVTVLGSAGPFVVTQPNTPVNWAGGSIQTVTWDVANTNSLASQVRILLSTDGGLNFPLTLAASTPNDGAEAVLIPNIPTTTARIKVEAVGNIFFDLSNTNFTISPGVTPPSPLASAAGPDTVNGTVNTLYGTSTAGWIVTVAGNETILYAVALNSGVWKSVNGGPWSQLPASPERAYSIAVDPKDSTHLVVGEREGDLSPRALNQSGVWESRDAGATWTYIFNPLAQTGCQSQAIPAVVFSPQSTLFIATACGIGQRRAGEGSFTFPPATQGLGLVTALTVSDSKVWGRTRDKLLISANDGQNWTMKSIPSSLDNFSVTFPDRGDLFSLTAFDSAAFMTCGYDPTPPCGNLNRLLIYNANADRWILQPRQLTSGTGCSGVGIGGQRFVKAFSLKRTDLPNVGGQRLQLFYGAGQEVYQATGLNADGTASSWRRATAAVCPGCAPNPDPVHANISDFHLASNGSVAWVTGDGGVFEKHLTNPATFAGATWVTRNQSLHTHHAHAVTVLPTGANSPARIVYATGGNDGWIRDEFLRWSTLNVFGNANFTAGDPGNPAIALISRNTMIPWLTGFNSNLPNGRTFASILINKDQSLQPYGFILQFIQTLKGESPTYPLLDAVMLQKLPLGNPAPNGEQVLIRNRQFASQLDKDITQFKDWTIEANNLPAGTKGFSVGGGHVQPIIYLYAVEGGRVKLYKRVSTQPPQAKTQWQELTVSGNLVIGSSYGPVFVNPFDANQLFALTDTGVKVSSNGGASFQPDDVLTALVTGSGKFPLTGNYFGGNSNNVVIANRGNAMATLAHMAFNRDNPREIVAASPFTGVFYNNGNGQWRDLSPALPRPRTPVAAVGLDSQTIYAATVGRGLVQIINYRNGRLASYFETVPSPASSSQMATLRDASKAAIVGVPVVLRITSLNGAEIYQGSVQTDAAGQIFLLAQIQRGTYVVHLQFNGNDGAAPSETCFLLTKS